MIIYAVYKNNSELVYIGMTKIFTTRVLLGTRHTFINLQFEFLTDYQLHGFKQLPKNCGYKTKGVLYV
jgi:steroid 5-alpha reductase family enzyme